MISIPRLRKELNFTAEQDEELAVIKQTVIDLWEKETAMLWDLRTARVEVHRHRSGPRPRNLLLELQPATTITKVEERGVYSGSAWATIDSDNYILFGRRQLENLVGSWAPLVRVTYDGGASLADEDVQKALIIQAQFMISRLDSSKISITAQNFRGGSGTFEEAFLHPFFSKLAERRGALI